MRSRLRLLLALVTALAAALVLVPLGAPTPDARANDTALGSTGGGVVPVEQTDVRLEAETVQAVVFGSLAEYRVDFRFINDGEHQEVVLGFPFSGPSSVENRWDVYAFRAWRDGKPLAVELAVPASDDSETPVNGYYLHRAVFPPGPTTITVRYLGSPAMSSGNRFYKDTTSEGEQGEKTAQLQGWENWYTYWLHTGAAWKGSIGHAVVRFSLADTFTGWGMDLRPPNNASDKAYRYTSPLGYTKPSPRSYQWVYTDFEPSAQPDRPWSEWVEYPYNVRLEFEQPHVDSLLKSDVDLGPFVYRLERNGEPDERNMPLRGGTGHLDGLTAGDRLRLEFPRQAKVAELRIAPGDLSGHNTFPVAGRPRSLRVSFPDGSTSTVELKDEPSLQRFPLRGQGEWVEVELLDTYPGSRAAGVHIWELEFGAQKAPGFVPFDSLIKEKASPGSDPVELLEGAAVSSSTTAATAPVAGSPTTALTAVTAKDSVGETQAADREDSVLTAPWVAAALLLLLLLFAAGLVTRRKGWL